MLVACRAGVLGAGISPARRWCVDGTVPAGPRSLAPLSSARTSGLGCSYSHEQVRHSLAKLVLLGK